MIDPSIITRGAEMAQLQQRQNMDALADLSGNLGQLVLGRRINQMRQLKTPEEQQAFANNSIFSPMLNTQLTADRSAAAKAANDQLKFNADLGKTYAEIGKIGSESGKIGAETGKINTETGITRQNNAATMWNAYLTGGAGAAKAVLEGMKARGLIDDTNYQAELAALTDLDGRTAAEQQQYALGRFKGVQDPKYSLTTADNVLDNQTSVDNNVRSTNVQKYGIDKTAETADENRAVQMQRLEFDQQQAYFQKNKPVGFGVDVNGRKYAIMPDGNSRYIKDENGNYVIEQVKGGSGSGLTEQQSKDALFGARMQEAHKILTALETKDIKAPVINSVIPFGIGAKISNALPSVMGGASAEQQQYVQAQRDFINAVLRKESGAVIADSEFENAQKQYFPQIGDSDEVIAQKAKNRELAMRMIVNGSGVQGQALINSATNSQNQLQPGQVPSAGAGGSALSFYK